jgi:hypothetical protein
MKRLLLVAAAGAAAYACFSAAKAAEFRQDGLIMTMTGRIEHGDANKLHSAMRGAPPAVLVIDSDGGYIQDAVMIANWLRQAKTLTEVRGVCWSACIIVFGAGYQRWAGPAAEFRVHRASTGGAEDSIATKEMATVYRLLGIPAAIIAKMLATSPYSFTTLSPSDLAAWQVKPKG